LIETSVWGLVFWISICIPLESISFIRFKRAWFYRSTSILRTSANATFFCLLSRNLNFSGRSLLTLLLKLFIFCSWIFHDLFTSLSKHSLLLIGIARNILQSKKIIIKSIIFRASQLSLWLASALRLGPIQEFGLPIQVYPIQFSWYRQS